MNILNRIIKDSSLSLLAEFIGKAATFLIFIIIAREFGKEVFGQYSYALSFVVIFVTISDFGIGVMLTREVAIDKNKASLYISNSLFIKIIFSAVAIIAIFVSTYIINKPIEVNLLIYLLVFYMLFKSFNDFSYAIFKAYEKIKYITYLKIVESILLVSFLSVLILLNQDLITIILSFSISSFIILLVSFSLIRRKFTKFSIRRDKKIVRFLIDKSLPFAVSAIFLVIYFNLDTLMLSFIKGDRVTGIYSASYNLFYASTIFVQPLGSVLYPVLSRKISEFKNNCAKQRKLIDKVLLHSIILVTLGIILTLMYLFFADLIIKILYGQEFVESVESLKILSLIIPFWYVCMVVGTIFTSLGKHYIFTYILSIGIIFNMVLNLILIPVYAEIGAAIASLITTIILMLLSVVIIKLLKSKYEKCTKVYKQNHRQIV